MQFVAVYFIAVLVGCLRCLEAKKSNVLFLIVDDLRPALGVYGDKNAFTPNIDKFAEKSFVFTNAFAQQALCAPSRNSLLTSRRPDSLHLYDFYSYWRQTVGNFTTLPQLFKENGYETYSIGKVFHPGISSNFTDDAVFSWSKTPFHPFTERFKESPVCIGDDGHLHRNLLCPVIVNIQPGANLPDLESLQEVKSYLNNRINVTTPFFLAVGLHKPHLPLKFPIKYLDYHPIDKVQLPENSWKPSSLPSVAWNPWLDVKSRDDIKVLNISFPFGKMPDDMTKRVIQHYNAAVSYIDDIIGSILEEIDKTNTIVVLTSDHGWSRGEHGEFSKFSNYQVATKVPLIIFVPKLSRSKIYIESVVELVDLFPTLVDLTQVTGSELAQCSKHNKKANILCTEGRSLVSLMAQKVYNLENPKNWNISAFWQYPRPEMYPTIVPNSDKPHLKDIKIMGYTIRTSRYRYTEWIEFNHKTFTPNWNVTYAKELYNLFLDPEENLNLANRNQLQPMLSYFHKKLVKSLL